MSSKERELFLKLINQEKNTNPTEPFEEEALEGARLLGKKAFAEALADLDQQIDQKVRSMDKPVKNYSLIWLAAAASIVLIMGFYFIYNSYLSSSKNDYLTYFEPFPNVITSTQRGPSQTNTLAKAMYAYDLAEYKTASELLIEYSKSENANNLADFYLGVCYIAMQKPELGREKLMPFKANTNIDFREASLYYISIAHIQLKQPDSAAYYAKETLKMNGYFFEKSKQLLDKL